MSAAPALLSLPSPIDRRWAHGYALALLAVFSLVRLWIAASGQIDLAQDEAQYWDWSRRLQLSYYSKGPLIAWLIALCTPLFGNTELGVRFAAFLGNLGAQTLLYYWLAVLHERPKLGLLALIIANTMPLFIAGGILMTTDNPLLLCWSAGLVCLSALTERPVARWPLVGLFAASALGILAKYAMLFFLGLAFVYLWRIRTVLPRERLAAAALALVLGTLAGLIPILIWNAAHGFVSFFHVGALAGVAGKATPFFQLNRFPEYLGSQLGLTLPWWLAGMLLQGVALWRHRPAQSAPVFQDRDSRFYCLLCLGFWPVWLFFLLWSLHTRIYPNWSAMSYVAGVVLAALWLLQRWRNAAAKPGQRLALKAALIVSLLVSLALHGQQLVSALLPLPERLNPVTRLRGWSDLGRQLEEARQAMPHPERVFFFSDAYDVTAALAFYLPGHPVTFCADFGRRLNQYDFWPDPNGQTFLTQDAGAASGKRGWDALFVSRRPLRKIPDELERMFARTGTPVTVRTTHQGLPGRTFGFMPLYEYNGYWPRPSRSY